MGGNETENQWTEQTHYMGVDWSKRHHNVVVVDRVGKIMLDLRIEHTAEGWQTQMGNVSAHLQTLPPGNIPETARYICFGDPILRRPGDNQRKKHVGCGPCQAVARAGAATQNISPAHRAVVQRSSRPRPFWFAAGDRQETGAKIVGRMWRRSQPVQRCASAAVLCRHRASQL